MRKFTGVDFYDIDELLTDEERMIRDTVRQLRRRARPAASSQSTARDGTFPTQLVAEMAELGLLGANLTRLRLRRHDAVAYGLIMQELERGDSGLRSLRARCRARSCMYPIYAYGSEEQKQRWLPRAGARARRSAASASPSPTSARTRAAC